MDDQELTLPSVPTHMPGSPSFTQAQASARDDQFQVQFEYNERTNDIEIAPNYPLMPPIPDNFDDLGFLRSAPSGNATIHIVNPDGSEFYLRHLNLKIIAKASSVLATSFQQIRPRQWELTLHSPQTPIIALLRAVYQDDYTFCEAMIYRPIPLLLHLQIIALANKYRMSTMEAQAERLAADCLAVTGSMRPPVVQDICASIKFVYTELRSRFDLREALATYCVVNFQGLQGELFRQMAFECPAFHKDLQRANYRDLFSQPHASAITRLIVCEHWIHVNDMEPWQGQYDFTCQLHAFGPSDSLSSWKKHSLSNAIPSVRASSVTPRLFNSIVRGQQSGATASQAPGTDRMLPIRTKTDSPANVRPRSNQDNKMSLPLRWNDSLSPLENESVAGWYSLETGQAGPATGTDSNSQQTSVVSFEPEHLTTLLGTTSVEDWNQVAVQGQVPDSRHESFDDQSDSEWTDVGTPSQQTAPNESDDYEILSSDSEWSVVEKS